MKDPKTQLCTTITNKVKGMTIPNCVRKANVRLSTQAWLKVEKINVFFMHDFFSYFLISFLSARSASSALRNDFSSSSSSSALLF